MNGEEKGERIADDMNSSRFKKCEALVDEAARKWLGHSAQCSRNAVRQERFAGVYLCRQHERRAEQGVAMSLVRNRQLIIDWHWSQDGWRQEILGARVVEITTDLEQRRRDQTPAGCHPVTDEERRAAAEKLSDFLSEAQSNKKDQ